MRNFSFIYKQEFVAINLIILLSVFRIIPHPPNFTPIIAMAILSGYFFRNIYLSLTTLIISMLLSDFFIGFYKNMFFIYCPLIFLNFIFFKINKIINYKNLIFFGFVASLIFYLISNFGVWLTGNIYEKNLNGLLNCYIMAIPFFKNTLLSTTIFLYVPIFLDYYLRKNFLLINKKK